MKLRDRFFGWIPSARGEWFVAILALFLLCLLGVTEITGSPAVKDAGENLQMAVDLERQGIVSIDDQPPYRPSMEREPIPVFAYAAMLYLVDAALGKVDSSAYFSGERIRYVKLQNLLWLCLLAISAYVSIRWFTASFWAALLGSALAVAPFTWLLPASLKMTIGVDSLATDLAGAALLSAASLLLAVGITRRDAVQSVGAGLCFGVLALTKAAALYVFGGVFLVVAVYLAAAVIYHRTGGARSALLGLSALTIPFLLITLPWMYRNYAQTGYFAISERAGSVILCRAFMDDATSTEYVGSFTAWGNTYARILARVVTGFTQADLDSGGRLQRLSWQLSGTAQEREQQAEDSGQPAQTVTWYRKSRAIFNAYLAAFTAAGHRYPSGAADEATKKEAFRLIVQHPIKHAVLMVPLIWRGALTAFPILVITLIYAWRNGRADLAFYALPPLALILFYAVATHFDERYGYVPYPLAIVCLCSLLAAMRLRRLAFQASSRI